jgi:hypothetical protein
MCRFVLGKHLSEHLGKYAEMGEMVLGEYFQM